MALYGVDVSFHKGFPDWSRAKQAVGFAILGVTELYGKDASFEHNFKGCKDNGIPVGAYKFSYALSWSDSKHEAEDIVNILRGRKLEFPIFLDLEWNKQTTLGENALREIIEGFREGIENGGYRFGGIYCNLYWYNTFIPQYAKDKYNFWISSYPYSDNGLPVESLEPKGVKNLVGWQYSECGNVPGFEGNPVDMDLFWEDYGAVAPSAPVSVIWPTLSLGSVGGAVQTLQTMLNEEGENLEVDGVFGPKTQEAVIAYQIAHSLEPDGIVGPLTWNMLLSQGVLKTPNEIAKEVIRGDWGVGSDRRDRLTKAGYDYEAIQKIVNEMLEG